MWYKLCFMTAMLGFSLGIAADTEIQPVQENYQAQIIILQQEEIDAIASTKESYVYFGPEIGIISENLLVINKVSCNKAITKKYLELVCALIEQGKTTAPTKMVTAALEEAVACLAVAQNLSEKEITE